ncbi:MAG TPA: CBS domain-containing protein [Ferruginibacter sp.]|nr:CBS domain-containing protein [Ferruginibacter sp.]HPH90719.1 CBS domain-containing protein [Ferruginibacter sp.]
MKVSDILQKKGSAVIFATSSTSVLDALKLMSEKNIGALLVIDDGKLTGIFSERDYARKVVLKGKASADTAVKEIMTESPFTVQPEDSIETCMGIMSDKHIRHLPVVKEGTVAGMISIGDVVTTIIQSQKETIDQLKNYISQ